MAALQKISPLSAGMNSSPPILSPNFCWKGSSMVTYPASLIFLAKKRPPENRRWWQDSISTNNPTYEGKGRLLSSDHGEVSMLES